MCEAWLPVPDELLLAGTAVHLYRLPLNQDPAPFAPLLTPEEESRATHFYFTEDKRRFMVTRGVLRLLIGRYQQIAPEQVSFSHNKFGKPLLPAEMDLHFNVSHSRELALLAFTRGALIGVDIEWRRPLSDAEAVAKSNFSASEYSIFRQLPQAQKTEAFFNCWTRKEAFIKAIGEGLSHPLRTFDVTFVPGDEPRFLRIEGEDIAEWGLQDIQPHPDFAAALTLPRPHWSLTCYQWGLVD